jgi:Holliday junction resolvase RusA-like endonuclease
MTRWTLKQYTEHLERNGALGAVEIPFLPPPSPTVVVELSGPPKGKGRPRFSRRSGVAYTPAPTREYEKRLCEAAQSVMLTASPMEGPLKVTVEAFFEVPRSWSKVKRKNALCGLLRPIGKPDADNVLKCTDALNGVVWRDDSQIVMAIISKRYSDRPRLRIEVEAMLAEGE